MISAKVLSVGVSSKTGRNFPIEILLDAVKQINDNKRIFVVNGFPESPIVYLTHVTGIVKSASMVGNDLVVEIEPFTKMSVWPKDTSKLDFFLNGVGNVDEHNNNLVTSFTPMSVSCIPQTPSDITLFNDILKAQQIGSGK